MKTIINEYHQNKHIEVIQQNDPSEFQTRPIRFNVTIRNIVNGNLSIFNGITLSKAEQILKDIFK